MSVFKFTFGASLAVYPTLRLAADVPVLKAAVTTVCIVLGALLIGDAVIEYAFKRGRERWRR